MRLLIADDDSGALAALAAWAEGEGFEVTGRASDGEEALSMAASELPDVALLDVRMPNLDGLAAAEAFKQRWPEVSVVLLTAYQESFDHIRATAAHVYCVCVKDSSLDLLGDILRSAASAGRSVAEGESKLGLHVGRASEERGDLG